MLDPSTIKLHRMGNGPPLILLHCLGMTHRMWDGLHGLADRYELISYDLPGHGETRLPDEGYGVEDLSAQLHEVMLREGIARAHLMGISLGGLVAQHFAATWPAMVDHLVLADTTPRYTEEMRAGWTARAKMARDNGAASLLPLIEKSWFTPGFVAAGGPAIQFTRATFKACGGEGYAKACEALGAADLRALAPAIKAPTLVFCGSDESVAFKEATQWLGEHIAGARVETIPVAGHATVLEQPEHVTKLVRAFLG